jgi:hypothetical protein
MSRLSIARRLTAGFTAVLVLVALILSICIWRLNHTARETEALIGSPKECALPGDVVSNRTQFVAIRDAINQIDETTQQNAALVEQSAAAAQSLEHQSRLLLEAASVFKPDGAPA